MIEILPSLLSPLISILAAFIILKLQRWYEKKKYFNTLYSEAESNLLIAENLLPLAEAISGKKKESLGTVFDLQRLYTYCYEDFKRSGYFILLDEKTRNLLEEVYEIISSHNSQTNVMIMEQMNIPEYIKLGIPPPQRTGGYTERLTSLIPKLKDLRDYLRAYL